MKEREREGERERERESRGRSSSKLELQYHENREAIMSQLSWIVKFMNNTIYNGHLNSTGKSDLDRAMNNTWKQVLGK